MKKVVEVFNTSTTFYPCVFCLLIFYDNLKVKAISQFM